MNKPFPEYRSHEEARCFNCGGALRNWSKSGCAVGDGAFTGRCADCGVATWYDIETAEAA